MIDKEAADTIHGILTLALGHDWSGKLIGIPPGFELEVVERAIGQLADLRRRDDDRMTITSGVVTLDLPGWVPYPVVEAFVSMADSIGVYRFSPAELAVYVEGLAEMVRRTSDLLAAIDPGFEGLVTLEAINSALVLAQPSGAANDGEKVVALRSAKHTCTVHNIVHATTVFARVTDDTVGTSELSVMSLGETMTLPGGASIVRTADGWELWQA